MAEAFLLEQKAVFLVVCTFALVRLRHRVNVVKFSGSLAVLRILLGSRLRRFRLGKVGGKLAIKIVFDISYKLGSDLAYKLLLQTFE